MDKKTNIKRVTGICKAKDLTKEITRLCKELGLPNERGGRKND